jgi:predicted permease
MSWIAGARARLKQLLGRAAAEERMDEEIRFHIEMETEKNIRAGAAPVEARRRALIAFGGVEHHREAVRDTWRPPWLQDLAADVRFALRWLRRTPGFAAVAVITIGVGIGATTTLFSVTHALLLRPLAVHEPERLYSIQEERTGRVQGGLEGIRVSHGRYEAYVKATAPVFENLAAHGAERFALRADGPAERVSGVLASGNYFQVLGVRPAHGRLFSGADEPVVVLSHRLWERRFAGDPAVVGRTAHVDGRPVTVVGVAERDFTGTTSGLLAEIWLPYRAATEQGESIWSDLWLTPLGRLRPEVDPRQAESLLPAIARNLEEGAAGAEVQGARLESVTGLPAGARSAVAAFLALLLGMATLVLLVAAANIAGMQLARAVRRRPEVAIRLAMGAGRGRLVRQFLTESVVLYLLGGAVGLAIAFWVAGLIGRIHLPIEAAILLDVTPDLRVLAFGMGLAAVVGIASGLLPAFRASRADLAPALKGGEARGSARAGRGRGAFVAAQIALSVVLLAIAALFARTLQGALRIDPGFDATGVVVAMIDLPATGYDEARGRTFQDQLVERVRAMGDVESAALALIPLLSGSSLGIQMAPAEDPERASGIGVNYVDPEYFRTLRMDLLRGRGFDEAAGASSAAVVVNETLARRFWSGEDPLGRVLRSGNVDFEVVGLVRDGLYVNFHEEPGPFAFFPRQETYASQATLHVRTRTPPHEMAERIRQEVMLLDPDVAVESAGPLTAMMAVGLLPQRIGAYLVGGFGLLGLLLAGVGVYGVLSHQVAERTRELGIRVALGASAPAVIGLVIRSAVLVAALGVGIGIVLAAMLGSLIEGMVFGVSAHDPATFVGVPLLLLAVALLASFFPVRRAVRADPAVALRQE